MLQARREWTAWAASTTPQEAGSSTHTAETGGVRRLQAHVLDILSVGAWMQQAYLHIYLNFKFQGEAPACMSLARTPRPHAPHWHQPHGALHAELRMDMQPENCAATCPHHVHQVHAVAAVRCAHAAPQSRDVPPRHPPCMQHLQACRRAHRAYNTRRSRATAGFSAGYTAIPKPRLGSGTQDQ